MKLCQEGREKYSGGKRVEVVIVKRATKEKERERQKKKKGGAREKEMEEGERKRVVGGMGKVRTGET